ncbi:MAG: ATP-binding protein [Candidatus Omnitrophica bacterium]|nr:ATP-binding protein [Candidatus Omnitrophota bacterium]
MKKDQFKFLIREFHRQPLPETRPRDLDIPLSSRKIITVYGPRRSGKSYYFFTIMRKLANAGIANERLLYINFEDDRILPLKAGDFDALLEAYFELYPHVKNQETYFFLDEIQNIKDWEIFVRRIHDKEKARIFLTGSSSKLLSKEIATSLRGRTISFALYPLSFREFLGFRGITLAKDFEYDAQRFDIKKALEEYLEHGGFPEIVLEENGQIKDKILEEYFESLVFRDLAERYRIKNMTLLKDLLKYLFANNTTLFSINSYYKSAKQSFRVSRQTVLHYLRSIQDTNYITLLPKFAWSLKEQRVNPQKIICLDTGIRNRTIFRFSKDEGRAAENVVGATIIRAGDPVYYWHGKREVDFIVQRKNGLAAINVTFGVTVNDREIDGLLEFKEKFSRVRELVLITKDAEETRKSIKLVPLWKWLLHF